MAVNLLQNDMEEKMILGIDWGEKRIGTALCDSITKIATPFKVVSSYKEILDIIEEEDVSDIVLGLPHKMKKDDKFHSDFILFKEKIEQIPGINFSLEDERLSSKAGDRLVGNKKTKASRDAIAAMIILQSYLDSKFN